MINVARASKALLSPRRGDLRALELTERGRRLTAWCPDDEIFTLSRELVLDRIYESGSIRLRPGMGTVVDAGAHVGIFSLLASQWAHRVVALEASPINFGLLSLNVHRNRLVNVEPRHCALWAASTAAVPFSAGHHSGGGAVIAPAASSRPGPAGSGSESTPTSVRATSLDDLVSELGPIDLLKIDIEGAEYDVFDASDSLASISQIVGEMHLEHDGDRARLDRLVDKLTDSGFLVSLVTETELLSTARLSRLFRNRKALTGSLLVKALAASYYLAPITKPIRPPGATYQLPILLAERPQAPTF